MKCDVCGGIKESRSKTGRCFKCGNWFATIKSNLWITNPKQYREYRDKGML